MPDMKQNEHGRLIFAAAKAHLRPLGCQRKGQSRFWRADHRFWQIGVEFQPSGWSRGSYLNVGVQWLWYPKRGFSFDTGGRIAHFVPFESPTQFALEADRLAARASEEVWFLRSRFSSLPAIAHDLVTKPWGNALWPLYHGAVAAGLTGDVPTARNLFGQLLAAGAGDGWWRERHEVAARLASCLDNPGAYHAAVLALIGECRTMQRLPLDLDCFGKPNPALA